MRFNTFLLAFFMLLGYLISTNYANFYMINYKNYQVFNISASSFQKTLQIGNTIIDLNTAYTYINSSLLNSTLAAKPSTSIQAAGYLDGNFIGNLTFIPFHTGYLISNTTTSGKSYVNQNGIYTIVFFYNQLTPTPNLTATIPKLTSASTLEIRNKHANYNIYFYKDTSGLFTVLESINIPLNLTSSSYLNYSQYSTTETFAYKNFNIPYTLIYSPSNAAAINLTLDYYPTIPLPTQHFQFRQASTKATMSGIDTFYNNTVSTTNANTSINLIMYNNPNVAYSHLITDGQVALLDNSTILNSTKAITNPPLMGTFYSASNYQIKINYYPFTSSAPYILAPTFGIANVLYTATNTITNATPLIINKTSALDSGDGWHYDFNYRISFNISNWTMGFATIDNNYTTANNVNYNQIKTVYKIGSRYALITIPYYKEMGNATAGWQLYLEAYNPQAGTDLGKINFAVFNYSQQNQYITLLISNTTNESYTVHFGYIEFGSRSNLTGFNNQSLVSNFEKIFRGTNTSQSISLTNYTNWILKITPTVWNTGTYFYWTSGSGNLYLLYNGTGYVFKNFSSTTPIYTPELYQNNTFLIQPSYNFNFVLLTTYTNFYNYNWFSSYFFSYFPNTKQMFRSYIETGYDSCYGSSCYPISVSYSGYLVYTSPTVATLMAPHVYGTVNNTIQYYYLNQTPTIINPLPSVPKPLPKSYANTSLLNTSANINTTAFLIKNNLAGTITLYNFQISKISLFFIVLILILIMLLLFNTEALLVGLITLWLLGIVYIPLIILATIMSLIYIHSKME